jgi:hypothetical protein
MNMSPSMRFMNYKMDDTRLTCVVTKLRNQELYFAY